MKERVCKDCTAQGHTGTPRNAAHPGPRCATHHRLERARIKEARHERAVQRVYGLGAGVYDEIYEFQGGRCALCVRATGASKRLAVDHDHKTGEPRGLLCSTCNQMLAHARDDPRFFERCVMYLLQPPFKIMNREEN